jgi:hypothetical protein
MFCRSLFVLLYFFFWPLCCLFFFNIRILIAPLVSSNSSSVILLLPLFTIAGRCFLVSSLSFMGYKSLNFSLLHLFHISLYKLVPTCYKTNNHKLLPTCNKTNNQPHDNGHNRTYQCVPYIRHFVQWKVISEIKVSRY